MVRLHSQLLVRVLIGALGCSGLLACHSSSVIGRASAAEAAGPAPASPSAEESERVLSQAAVAINDVAKNAMPAVVSIVTVKHAGAEDSPFHGATPWNLFGPSGPGDSPDDAAPASRSLSLGSGVMIRPGGIILTNNHVIENAERVTVNFDERHKSVAEILGTDPKTDIAVIKVKDLSQFKDARTLPFADSEKVKVGDWAIAVGSPFGLKRSVSVGIVSATGRGQMGVLDTEDFIQTDAAINPGSSGGPLLNARGEIIGLNTAIFSQSGGFIGIGFAIPSRIASDVANQIIDHGHVIRGYIGLAAQDLDDNLSRYFKISSGHGALVTQVMSQGPAGKGDLKAGDVITKFGNQSIESADQLKSLVAKTAGGTDEPVELIREGKNETHHVRIAEQPAPPSPHVQLAGQIPGKGDEQGKLGLSVRDVIPELASFLKLPARTGALVVAVQPGSPAFDAGLMPGDVVLRANQVTVHGAKELAQVAHQRTHDGITVFYVQRGPGETGEKLFVPIKAG